MAEVPGVSQPVLRQLIDQLRRKGLPTAALLASREEDKVVLVAGISEDLQTKGVHAGEWVARRPWSWAAAAAAGPIWPRPAARIPTNCPRPWTRLAKIFSDNWPAPVQSRNPVRNRIASWTMGADRALSAGSCQAASRCGRYRGMVRAALCQRRRRSTSDFLGRHAPQSQSALLARWPTGR